MPSPLSFAKMHGCRNDYVVVDADRHAIADPAALARAVCDRRAGVGADGLLLVSSSAEADFRMRMLNVDGSAAEMCGNGLRCAAVFAVARGLCAGGPALTAETGAGRLPVEVHGACVTVDMGAPALTPSEADAIDVGGTTLCYTPVALGNPHAVVFVDDVEAVPIAVWGPRIETDPRFPARTNVEFVEVLDPGAVRQRTWERGCGETPACGTGASAVVVAGATTGRTDRRVRVHLRGGELDVEWSEAGTVRQTGPVAHVFDGTWPGGGS